MDDEYQRMLLNADRNFQDHLNQHTIERARQHQASLAQAEAEHTRIRDDAIQYKLRFEREQETELEHRQRVEELRKREEEFQRDAERRRELAEAEARVRARKEQEAAHEEQRRKNEEAHRQEEARAAATLKQVQQAAKSTPVPALSPQRANLTPVATMQPSTQPKPTLAPVQSIQVAAPVSNPESNALVSSVQQRENIHKRWLQIHQNLKAMRSTMKQLGNQDKSFKETTGDMRRGITKFAGQLSIGVAGANKNPMDKAKALLARALTTPSPKADVRQFFFEPSADVSDVDAQVSILLVYILNQFSKAIVRQIVMDRVEMAEPVGIMAVSIFASPEFQWRGRSLIDMLVAKYHRVCPVLFGIYGKETTDGGRRRLGWKQEDGGWVSEQTHSDRMSNLATGFAAISLRNFSKSRNENPFPAYHYWRSFSMIVNTPPDQVTNTHMVVLSNLIQKHTEKFIQFYGQAAKTALRKALVELPQHVPQGFGKTALEALRETLKKDLKLGL